MLHRRHQGVRYVGWPCPALPTPVWKRAIDIAVAGTVLVLSSPVLLVIAVTTRVLLGPGVLFVQERGGHGGVVFRLLKFRTMLDRRDADGLPLPDTERTHWWGSLVRRLSLDELPSLINVLLGDMSLVGPRPFLAVYLERYSPEQSLRHSVLPGITGLAQTRGRNIIAWDEKFGLDLHYVSQQSLRLDLRILFDTLRVVLSRSGADGVTHATEFLGDPELSYRTGRADPQVIPIRPPVAVAVPDEPINDGFLLDAVTTLDLSGRI